VIAAAAVRQKSKRELVPSLDGLRAISIALVLIGHAGGTRGLPRIDFGVGSYARLGVIVFFVISGFLITMLLQAEHARKGCVSLKLFYMRRALRLFPAAYAYLTCISFLWMADLIALRGSDLWHAATYTVNYLPDRSWQVGHLWSLSVEEQFYLLWPLAFVTMRPGNAARMAAAVMIVGPVARAARRTFLAGTPYQDMEMFPMVADSLATGCLLAYARGWLEGRSWYLRLFQPWRSAGLLALILLINRYMDYTVVRVAGTSVVNLGIAVLIHRCVYSHGDPVGRILNWRPVAFIGTLSYSLYLWQQLFLNRDSTAWINAFPQNLVFTAAAALCSYLFLEKPLMQLRRRLGDRPQAC
jgi:peptidoglycan/LPS O-acetylase OafA/YrhL